MNPKTRQILLDEILCDYIDTVKNSDDYLSDSIYDLLIWADKDVSPSKDAETGRDAHPISFRRLVS